MSGKGEPPRFGAASLEAERGGQLLDVERDAVGAVVERLDGVRVELAAGDRRREPGRALAVEGLERQLDEVAHAAQLRAQPAEPCVSAGTSSRAAITNSSGTSRSSARATGAG